jgi:hypothetical protein
MSIILSVYCIPFLRPSVGLRRLTLYIDLATACSTQAHTFKLSVTKAQTRYANNAAPSRRLARSPPRPSHARGDSRPAECQQ